MTNNTDTYHLINLETWPRKEHFHFYQQFEQPYFNICCDLNAKELYNYCQKHPISFFDAYIFLVMKALNKIDAFKYRLADEQVRVYDKISVGVTQMAADQTFRFSEIDFSKTFSKFQRLSAIASDNAKNENFWSERVQKNQQIKNTVYITVIPWISFTSFSHAKYGQDKNGIPRLVFGKMNKDTFQMPFSIDVHHSLVDGLHVGDLVKVLQEYFDSPALNLAV